MVSGLESHIEEDDDNHDDDSGMVGWREGFEPSQPTFICSKLTIETLEKACSSVSIVTFDQVNAGWIWALLPVENTGGGSHHSKPSICIEPA